MNIPNDHQQVMPYLILKGAEEFIRFTSNVFGAELIAKHLRDETGAIVHAEIRIGDSVIMLAEATEQWPQQPTALFIYVENADATYQKALGEGAVSISSEEHTSELQSLMRI